MNCTQCDNKTEVLETRKYKDYPTWNIRTRKCLTCTHQFKTLEMTIEDFQKALSTHDDDQGGEDGDQG
jgi:transcriptional regulator NrdR family protein